MEMILVEASKISALASLDDAVGFTLKEFRTVFLILHKACQSLAGQHSHVNVSLYAHNISRRWMVNGDDVSLKSDSKQVNFGFAKNIKWTLPLWTNVTVL